MPLKIVPPDAERRQPNYRIRGTYLGVGIDRTTGSPDLKVARKALRCAKEEIECGRYAPRGEPTWADAALAYVKAGGEDRFLTPLTDHFTTTALRLIDQAAIDKAAVALYPDASPATRNRQVYTPVSAVLKGFGVETRRKRPKGSRGTRRTVFLVPDQAGALLVGAAKIDGEFGLFCLFLLYTGCRLNEGLNLEVDRLHLGEAWAWVQETKNGDARLVHLPPVLVAALAEHPRGLDRKGQRVFRFSKCGRLYTWFEAACTSAGIVLPPRVAFHLFRHTWGAWMRRYGGLDTTGLVETGAWRSRQAASIYEHAIQSEEARRADLLPILTICGKSVG